MSDQQEEGYAVPRLHRLTYLEVALREVDRGASFERMRQALLDFARQTGEGQVGGGVISSLHDQYTFWSPTQEALSELMKLGFVVQAPVPSSRQYVDAFRANTYELTPEGSAAVQQLSAGGGQAKAKFLDMLTIALSEHHPGFADLLAVTNEHPLCIPEYTLERISTLAQEGPLSEGLAGDVITMMTEHWPSGMKEPSAKDLTVWLNKALERRFPRDRVRQPSQKDVLDTVDDAVLGFAARARKIRLDAISFNVCMSWAGQLAVLEESRYVEGWRGRTVWATAVIHDHNIHRRGFMEAEATVVAELRNGFRRVANATADARASGYLPIYRVRAQAAFAARVNLRLVDMILGRILSGEIEAPYQVQVALGRGTPPPRSEPVFTHDGRRFFDIMITE